MRIVHIAEVFSNFGFKSLFSQIVYFDREAVVLEKDLTSLSLPNYLLNENNMKILLIDKDNLCDSKLKFNVKSRYLKIKIYAKENGYGVILLVRDNVVVGDIWFYDSKKSCNRDHSDMIWLGIKVNSLQNYVYLYDMFIDPQERGKNLAATLQGGALSQMQKLGFTKAFGYYWVDNIPALWVNRLLKWKEIKRIKMNRFIVYKSHSS